jgi:hypothetical protein
MQPGRGGDARQLSGEVRTRRQAAESLRGELAQMGVTLPDLDQAIDALRRMEGERALADPRNLDALREAVAASLQRVEFELWRRFGSPVGSRPAAGVTGDAPAAYRALVEEYFRTIARDRR